MELNFKNQPNEPLNDQAIEQIRQHYSYMLKEYLRIYQLLDQLKNEVKAENPNKRFSFHALSLYDEKGKINWKIILQFMPYDMEKYI